MGTGSATKARAGYLVYAMRVSETLSFDQYWTDTRFRDKRPNISGSRKQQFGDNIYHRDSTGAWQQADSHHSYPGGVINLANVTADTRTNRVLVACRFVYWGGTGPEVPAHFRNWDGHDIVCPGVGHRCRFPDDLVVAVLDWLEPHIGEGFSGRPTSW